MRINTYVSRATTTVTQGLIPKMLYIYLDEPFVCETGIVADLLQHLSIILT